ncbi:MAG: ketoacyl-ACP synthase III [Bacteroidota bacterium]|nr:ketoacyl-ACP synthase III [Bacteroidota bacterium]
MEQFSAAITAVSGYVPPYILDNKELEKLVETNDEWIRSRTGIRERRILKGEGAGTSVLATEAVNELCKKRGIDPLQIEVLICATITPDMPFPSTANIICDNIGAKNALSFDMSAACSGFIYALETGSNFIRSGRYKYVVVIGADKMSAITNYKDRNSCILFGDGAGAVLLERNYEGLGVMDAILKTDGSGKELIKLKAGGSAYPISHEHIDAGDHYFYQDGKSVFKYAVTYMADVTAEILEKNNLTGEDIAYLVPHQANRRIIEATANRMNIGMEKVTMNIEKFGNTTAATIPLCLWEWEKEFKKNDNLILAAFGGGFTWGAVYLKWAY